MHLAKEEDYRNAYYGSQYMSISKSEICLTIIHIKVDHAKMASPCFASKIKNTNSYMRLSIAMIGMIVHGHGDVTFVYFSLNMYLGDSNQTIGSVAKLLRDLEKLLISLSKVLFENSRSILLFDVVLKGKEDCIKSLGTSLPLIPEWTLLPILHVQLDNYRKDKKSRYVFCFWSMLVAKRIFEEVFASFLLVGHTHKDIDTTFARWSMKLHKNNYPTIPSLI